MSASAPALAARLLREDGTPRSVREIHGDRERFVAAATLARSVGAGIPERQLEVFEAALGLGRERQSLAELARAQGVTRVRLHALFRQAVANLVAQARAEPVLPTAAGTDLVPLEQSPVLDAARWARLDPAQRRVRAVRAANERDGETLWQLTSYYLTTRGRQRSRLSDHTRAAYRRGVLDVVAAFAEENLLAPSSDAGALYLIQLETDEITRVVNGRTVRAPRSAATIAVRLAAAKALYRALRHVGATNADPFHDLRPPVDQAAPESKREAYTASEVRTLLAAAEPLDRAFIHLCATAGLRVSEATSLTWGQVRFEQGILAGVVGKGRRVRDVPAAADLLAALRAVRDPGWTPDEPVLPFGPAAARRRLRRLCELTGVRYEGRQVHGLRHTAGTEVSRRHGIDAAADLLRHANLQTTRRYSKRTPDERLGIAEDLARALSGEPRGDEDDGRRR